jgi:hypothetical protein
MGFTWKDEDYRKDLCAPTTVEAWLRIPQTSKHGVTTFSLTREEPDKNLAWQ